MTLRRRGPVRRVADGYELSLRDDERALLAALPSQVDAALAEMADADAAVPGQLARLFPPAFPSDSTAEASFVRLTRAELLEHHRSSLAVLAATTSAHNLDDEELESWLSAINDIRLVLGATLEVTEDVGEPSPDDPRYAEWVCYHYLSYLESEIVDALSGALPPPVPGADERAPVDPWGEPPGGLRWDGTPPPGST